MNNSSNAGVLLEKSRVPSPYSVRVGCAGWNIPRDFAANFSSGGSHLDRYSKVFNCCEINSSFYRPHKPITWERWAQSVPAQFQFSVKVPRTITHEAKLNCDSGILTEFFRQIKSLHDKLGPVLIQLPPSLQFELVLTRKFASMLRDNYSGDVVWEPRHPSWFNDQVDDLLKEFRIARVAADPACVPAASRPGGLPSLVYFRLHGSPRRYYSAYTKESLKKLSAQLASSAPKGTVWCVFDNTASGAALGNALELTVKLKKGRVRVA